MNNELRIMNLKLKTVISLLLASLFILLASAPSVQAQSFDIGIYPPIIQAQMTPPAKVNIPIFLENFKNENIKLKISLKPFKNTKLENGTLEFMSDDRFIDPNIANKITVLENNQPVTEINLLPNERKKFTLSFNFPQEQPWGEYYLSLIFASNSQAISGSTSSVATGGVGANILITMGEIGKTNGILEEFSSPKFITKGPLPFTVRLKNAGNHFITPTGNITITNIFGQTVGKVNLLEVNILANSVRRIPDEFQAQNNKKVVGEKIKKLIFDNKFPVAIWPKTFLLGVYKADLTLNLSANGPIFKKGIYIFAFPIELFISVVLVIVIIWFIVVKIRTKIKDKQ